MTDTAPSPLRADAQRNRERILDAAAELFKARGLDVSMEDIAHEAGVGVGTLYRRFRNRDELIDALFETRLTEFAEVVRTCAAMPDAWAGLVTMLERTLEIQAADRGLKHLFHQHAHERLNVNEVRDLVLDSLQDIVTRAQAAGALRADVQPMDVTIISFQIGSVADLTAGHDPDAWRRALAIALDGLRPPGDKPPLALPAAPLERTAFETAMECWRPPAPSDG